MKFDFYRTCTTDIDQKVIVDVFMFFNICASRNQLVPDSYLVVFKYYFRGNGV